MRFNSRSPLYEPELFGGFLHLHLVAGEIHRRGDIFTLSFSPYEPSHVFFLCILRGSFYEVILCIFWGVNFVMAYRLWCGMHSGTTPILCIYIV